jgi:hypothetical protein
MGKLDRWSYLASTLVKCLDRNRMLKMNERENLRLGPKENKNERIG